MLINDLKKNSEKDYFEENCVKTFLFNRNIRCIHFLKYMYI